MLRALNNHLDSSSRAQRGARLRHAFERARSRHSRFAAENERAGHRAVRSRDGPRPHGVGRHAGIFGNGRAPREGCLRVARRGRSRRRRTRVLGGANRRARRRRRRVRARGRRRGLRRRLRSLRGRRRVRRVRRSRATRREPRGPLGHRLRPRGRLGVQPAGRQARRVGRGARRIRGCPPGDPPLGVCRDATRGVDPESSERPRVTREEAFSFPEVGARAVRVRDAGRFFEPRGRGRGRVGDSR